MKELVSLAASHFTAHDQDQRVALTEVVLVTSEPEYAFDATGGLVRQRALSQVRFAATTKELREIAATLTLWADERETAA